ncbi:unnamed protein product [Effrenium voratum]|nr:unnamed protein product [Effrenium voratum]
MKLKRVSLSFSGASVFFFTPYRADGVPMPASVMKFDSKECVEDEMAKTEKFRSLFGSTTPKVNDFYLVEGEGPCSVMQIDLCGGVFGLPEFAKAPPVQTFASILEADGRWSLLSRVGIWRVIWLNMNWYIERESIRGLTRGLLFCLVLQIAKG